MLVAKKKKSGEQGGGNNRASIILSGFFPKITLSISIYSPAELRKKIDVDFMEHVMEQGETL